MKNFKYTDKEMKQLISSIVILIDTRDKNIEHITNWFDKHKIRWKSKKLDYADYSFMIPANKELDIPRDMYFDKEIAIERKGSLEELSGNISNGRDRFEKELALAPHYKVLLIENGSYSDIVSGNYQTQLNKNSYIGTLHKFWFKYNIPFVFMPNKKYTPMFIYKTFEYYIKTFIF